MTNSTLDSTRERTHACTQDNIRDGTHTQAVQLRDVLDNQVPDTFNLDKIFWIASYPKSGNTWVRLVLDAYAADREVPINTYYGHYATGDMHLPAYQSVCPWPIKDSPPYIIAALRVAALLRMMSMRMWLPVAFKTHHANIKVFDMRLIPPELTSAAVYIVRDPRDVAISLAHHMAITLDQAIEYMAKDSIISQIQPGVGYWITSWQRHVRTWTEANADIDTVVVRYEDMLADPMREFETIIEQSEFRLDRERLQRALERCSFDRFQQQEAEHGFREQHNKDTFFRSGTAGQWRDQLTAGQVLRLEETQWPMMQRMGYELVNEGVMA